MDASDRKPNGDGSAAGGGTVIVRAELVHRTVALRRPLWSVRGNVTHRELRLLFLEDEHGNTGVGEASRVDWLARGAIGDEEALAELLERIRDERPRVSELLDWTMQAWRPSAVRSALQTAVLDCEARRSGCTVAELLGAPAEAPPIALSALVVDDGPERMARAAEELLDEGLRCFKIKVGRREDGADLRVTAAVREAIGPQQRLRLDANGAWDVAEAQDAIEGLAHFDVDFVEEPLAERASLPSLRSAVELAVDESVPDDAALARAMLHGGFSVLVLKLERVGGPIPAIAMAERAARAGLRVVVTDSIDGPVGRAAALHLAAAIAARTRTPAEPVGLGGLFLLEGSDEVAGIAQVTGPGLGVPGDEFVE